LQCSPGMAKYNSGFVIPTQFVPGSTRLWVRLYGERESRDGDLG
jgi:hypothetical protein